MAKNVRTLLAVSEKMISAIDSPEVRDTTTNLERQNLKIAFDLWKNTTEAIALREALRKDQF